MVVRLYAFVLVLGVMTLWELLAPKRTGPARKTRWPSNFGVGIINVVMLSVVPISALAASLLSLEYRFGLFLWMETSLWPSIIASIVILDLVVYWQHRMLHIFKPLWRIHRMHHTDTAFDVTTALRFHPIEILLSIVLKGGVIVLLGAPILGVIAFEIILNGFAMFNHGNIRLPLWADKYLRYFIVTPDMHRVHHSVLEEEHAHNYGFFLSVWDGIFHSYIDQPEHGHETMAIGLDKFNDASEARLDKLLTQPFRTEL